MINVFSKFITSNTLSSMTQNTNSQVVVETTLKAIGRPGFILIDNDIDNDTRRYAAAKEFLYQATCLMVYASVVVPLFKNGAFKLANKLFDPSEIGKFKSNRQYNHYLKLCDTTQKNRILTLDKEIKGTANSSGTRTTVGERYDDMIVSELKKENPNKYPVLKGAVELGNIVGSVFGLAIFAPQVSHAFIHPALKFLGLEEKNGKQKSLDERA